MTTETQWVLDATMGVRDGMGVFCPIEGDFPDDFTVITGLNYIGLKPPHGVLVAVVHDEGQEAVEAFCEAEAEFLEQVRLACEGNEP